MVGSARLRAGLVGYGVMGRNHARVLRNLEAVDLVGIVDPGAADSGDVTLDDLDSLVRLGVDYIVVAAPTALHEQLALACAEAGVHALVEKPLTTEAARAYHLQRVFDDAGLIGAVGHIERYNPALQEAKRRLAEGQLGAVYQIVTRRQGPFPGRISDVGVILDLATHDFDLTAWVAQSAYARVFAQTTHRSGRRHEDLVVASCTLRDGTVTNHLVNWLSPLKERTTVITGEKGAFVIDTLRADLTFFENGLVANEWSQVSMFRGVTEGDVTRYAFPKIEPLRTEHENFRDAVLGVSHDIVSFAEGARTIAAANAAAESAVNGQVVEVA